MTDPTANLTERRRKFRKPRERRTEPNERVMRVASSLLDVATNVTVSLERCHEELSTIGRTGGGSGEKVSGSSSGRSSTERDAELIHELTAWREDMRDAIRDLEHAATAVRHLSQRHLPAVAPAEAGNALCMDARHGREGFEEWGIYPENPNPELRRNPCRELTVRDGLCGNCLQRERRWREKMGLPRRNEAS